MKLTFNVGAHERHSVDFSFDPMWGRLAIAVVVSVAVAVAIIVAF